MRDWRRREQYEFTQDLSLQQWAWEFLRRNPDYQADWAKALTRYREQAPAAESAGSEHSASPDHRGFVLRSQACIAKWFLFGYVNPAQDAPSLRSLIFCNGPRGGFEGRGPRDQPDVSQAQTVYVPEDAFAWIFDLQRELKPQLEEVGRILRELQEYRESAGMKVQRRKRHTKKWGFYLRLLDADQAGASIEEVAREFEFSGDPVNPDGVLDVDKVRDRLRAARRLTTPQGYIQIV